MSPYAPAGTWCWCPFQFPPPHAPFAPTEVHARMSHWRPVAIPTCLHSHPLEFASGCCVHSCCDSCSHAPLAPFTISAHGAPSCSLQFVSDVTLASIAIPACVLRWRPLEFVPI